MGEVSTGPGRARDPKTVFQHRVKGLRQEIRGRRVRVSVGSVTRQGA